MVDQMNIQISYYHHKFSQVIAIFIDQRLKYIRLGLSDTI